MQLPSITVSLSRHPRPALYRPRPAGLAAAPARPRRVRRRRNIKLRSAIRAHANFIEYVPIITLMVAMLEMSGLAATRVHLLMGALLLARLLHPLGMYAGPQTLQFQRLPGRRHHASRSLLLLACAAHRSWRARCMARLGSTRKPLQIQSYFSYSSLNFDTVKILLDDSRASPLVYLYDVKISPRGCHDDLPDPRPLRRRSRC